VSPTKETSLNAGNSGAPSLLDSTKESRKEVPPLLISIFTIITSKNSSQLLYRINRNFTQVCSYLTFWASANTRMALLAQQSTMKVINCMNKLARILPIYTKTSWLRF